MGLFSKQRGADGSGDELTLAGAWQLLAPQLGAHLEVRGECSILATGTVRGRGWALQIEGRSLGNAFLRELRTGPTRNKAYDEWTSELAVACANPRGLVGVVRSYQDPNDPNRRPGEYDPRRGRMVVSNPPELAGAVLTAELHRVLLDLWRDVDIAIEPAAVRIGEVSKARASRGGFIGGSVLHHGPSMVRPMPERAIAGPPWWIDLACRLADAVDRPAA
ncbi:MAG: hypothetical protein M9961_14025 [Ilumatobacteraceae bacterium]|nr:hypothetical protein [Ilumatobacter sp.]MCO5331189.1 hypothetical protein [Ilumatobacteraceae bacterium]